MKTPARTRLRNPESENEDLKVVGEGHPPRSANEPRGSEGSARSAKTLTDPASGESLPRRRS